MANIDVAAKNDCYNLEDSYGEICVHCGCCHEDERIRNYARFVVTAQHLLERMQFDQYYSDDPDTARLQYGNVKCDIAGYKRELKTYYDFIMQDSNEPFFVPDCAKGETHEIFRQN